MTSLIRPVLKKFIWFYERRIQVNGGVINAVSKGRRDQRFELAVRYFTWKRAFNLIRVELALRFGRTKIGGLPFEWEIDTTNICQLKCPLCHTGLGTIHRNKGVMHFDLFTKTIDQIKGTCIYLTLYSWGEPFLNRRIHEFVAYAHQNNVATIISSNLNKPLAPEMAESIINAGLDVMIISLDGITQDVYETYRVGGHLDRVLDNIRLLAQKKKELRSTTPHLEWQFIVMRQNEHQIEEAKVLANELGIDSIIFKKVDFPHGEDNDEVAERWLPRNNPEYLRPEPFLKPFQEDGKRCWRLWRTAVINWDGGFAPCCYLTDKAQDFGDLNENSVKEVWTGENYVTARGLFQKSFTPEKWVGCMSCSVYTGSHAARVRGPIKTISQPLVIVPNGKISSNGVLKNPELILGEPKDSALEAAEEPVNR